MPSLPNVLRAMQSIQRDTEEALANLDVLRDSPQRLGEVLELCTGILNTIWRTANDYESALPTIIHKAGRSTAQDNLGSDSHRDSDGGGRSHDVHQPDAV